MDDLGTDSLRKLAPSWTLAGDDQLLNILQNTHQKLLSKCQEANCQLEQMATALSDASISLQNVNNQFMALSSSQFIESRVYDDDDLGTEAPAVKEPPKPDIPDELSSLKRSISVLEDTHEIITILHDSDTESDTDDEITARMVLKPKDMYADRPLPYIIGSEPWKNKWHAGLVLEDSDSDSSASKVDQDSDQYSQSEPEDIRTDKLHVPPANDTTVSETSSELPSEQGSVPKPTPSDVASEVARRLGAREPPKMVERESEFEEPAKPAVRKIYRPQDPVPSTIFPESPPPLSRASSSGSDIFAELHRAQPYAGAMPATDLFANDDPYSDEGDIFSDFANKPVTDPSAKPPSLFDSGPAPHMFDKHTEDRRPHPDHHTEDRRPRIPDDHNSEERRPGKHDDHTTGSGDRRPKMYEKPPSSEDRRESEGRQENRVRSEDREVRRSGEEDRVKKPVGGISLFGNKGTESIGAAILKRNQRRSSSGDESGSDARSEAQEQQIKKEKDIFDDLFARSEAKKVTKDKPDFVKDIKTEIQKKTEEKTKDKKVEKKVDLFSDNLFDDIDDIFSSNVVKMPSKENAKSKSIFEDDDDLFSDIAAPKPTKIVVASSSNNKKSLFDSDDELFSENIPKPKPVEKPKISQKVTEVSKPSNTENSSKVFVPPKINKEITRSIFDDDEEDIFSDLKTNQNNIVVKVQKFPISNDKYNDISKGNDETSKNVNVSKIYSSELRSPSLFDDDDDESDLFVEPSKSTNIQNVISIVKENIKEIPIKNEIKTAEEKITSMKTDDFKQNIVKNDEFSLEKESSKSIENNNVHQIDSTFESNKSFEDDSTTPVLPASQHLERENAHTHKNIESNAAKIFNHTEKTIRNVEQSSSDTNEFSDQDFDDLPPKIEVTPKNVISHTNVTSEPEIIKTPIEVTNIFDKNAIEDVIFAKPEQKTENNEIFQNTEPDFLETITQEIKKTEQDNKIDLPATKSIEADIFSEILTEPPVFEKPKEPKRSKNVNALFDDDSDDESLFFKKNDPIFDENPDDFTPKQDRIFGLFVDEPPDDGFSKISDDLDDDMFSTIPKPKLPQNDNVPPIPDAVSVENIFIPKTEDKLPASEIIHPKEDIFSSLPKNVADTVSETPNIPVLDREKQTDSNKNIFKLPDIENVVDELPNLEQQKSDDEQLFNVLENASKPIVEEKQDIFSDDDSLFSSVPKLDKPSKLYKQEIIVNKRPVLENCDDELFNSLTNTANASVPESVENKKNTDVKSDEDFKIPKKPDFIPRSSEIPPTDKKTETKKVGKLKVGLNINVNALLPGASPKKAKPNDQPDGQAQSGTSQKPESQISPEIQKSEPKTPESQNTDSKLIKSVSFDGKPESDILDNKLSKERAKIQVKRRPSTRKARREAVRKSGIDFGEDSTDNSSSIDDPPRILPGNQPENSKKTDIANVEQQEPRQHIENESIDQSQIQSKSESAAIQPKIQAKNEPIIQPKNKEKEPEIIEKPSYSRDVKSKVVYILNDEDIFNTSPAQKPDLDKNPDRNIGSNSGVSTLGKVYDKSETKSNKKDTKTSLFDDENDEEIFKARSSVKKSSIFDSDSEEDLFGTSKKEVEKEEVIIKKEIKREVVKGSLFGDDDDDDDLFGVKTKKSVEQNPQASRSVVKETPKPAEPVFEDPLSMFGDDD